MSDLKDLISRLEKAEGPDRLLDAQIALRVAGIDTGPFIWDGEGNFVGVNNNVTIPEYTSSIDAALTLVPEGAGFYLDRYWIEEIDGGVWDCTIHTGGVPDNPAKQFNAWQTRNAALSVCIAALSARLP